MNVLRWVLADTPGQQKERRDADAASARVREAARQNIKAQQQASLVDAASRAIGKMTHKVKNGDAS